MSTPWVERERVASIYFNEVSLSVAALQDFGNFIKMGIYLIGQIIELTPSLAKVRRFVG
jgi:hypothetical protein